MKIAAVVLAALASVHAQPNEFPITRIVSVPGGWNNVIVSAKDADFLAAAIRASTNIKPTICLRNVQSLKHQVVNGYKYRFEISGCAVNQVTSTGFWGNLRCQEMKYDVFLFKGTEANAQARVTSVAQM